MGNIGPPWSVQRVYSLKQREVISTNAIKVKTEPFIMFEGRRPIIYPVYSTNNTLIIVRCYKQMCPSLYGSLGSEEITVGFV